MARIILMCSLWSCSIVFSIIICSSYGSLGDLITPTKNSRKIFLFFSFRSSAIIRSVFSSNSSNSSVFTYFSETCDLKFVKSFARSLRASRTRPIFRPKETPERTLLMGDPIQGIALDTKEAISSVFSVLEFLRTISSFFSFTSLSTPAILWHLSPGL